MSIIDYHRPKTKVRLLKGEHVHWIENNKRASYIRQCVLSFPPWVTKKELKTLWLNAREKEKLTGIPHVLGHIIPLKHPRVCGLTIAKNLKVITRDQNAAESNHWCEWHGDLFYEPEQFRLF